MYELTSLVGAGRLVLLEPRVAHSLRGKSRLRAETPPICADAGSNEKTSWVKFKVIYDKTGAPICGVALNIRLPNGSETEHTTRADGMIEIDEIQPGVCKVSGSIEGARLEYALDFVSVGERIVLPEESAPINDGAAHETTGAYPPVVNGNGRRTNRRRIFQIEKHKVLTGETLESIATAHGLTWQELAEFNWATSVPKEINLFLRDDVGCTKKTRDGKNYMFDSSDKPGIVYVPQAWSQDGLLTEQTHTIRAGTLSRIRLVSTFALEQLTGLAQHLSETDFWAWIIVIYGGDISIDAAGKLRAALQNGTFPNPRIDLVPTELLGGHEAAYHWKRRRIEIAETLPARALQDTDEAWKLMIALVEEFGHHVDNLLRNQYSTVGGNGPLDEGAAFAHGVVLLDCDRTRNKQYATYEHGGASTELLVDYLLFHEAVDKYLSEEAILSDGKSGSRSFFGPRVVNGVPGESFGHESVEHEAFAGMPAGLRFTEEEFRQVYFGNWLRDMSAFVDPRVIHGRDGSFGFSREALTYVIGVLAEVKFGNRPEFKVTKGLLGVYRPEEHIDSPYGIEDGTDVDPEFRSKWTPAEIAIDPQTGLANYIRTPGLWPTAVAHLRGELAAALAAGRTPDGLRRLGSALHVIEDYFAHSNFVEVALRKVGFDKVYPWVPVPIEPGQRIPLVTGIFAALDTLATIAFFVAETLQKQEPFELGRRSTGQKIALILLRDKYRNIAPYYEAYLNWSEDFERAHPWIWRWLYKTVGKVGRFFRFVLGSIIRSSANQIDDYQSAMTEESTNPTHTQLAKDHDDHPFHQLAAELATQAARKVASAMAAAWADKAERLPGTAQATYREYTVKDGDTLVSIATANGMTWQELAMFNWRTSDPDEINRHLRDEVGCTKKTADGHNYLFQSSDYPGALRIPIPAALQPIDVVKIAADFLVHPDDTDWMDGIVQRWGAANRDKVARGQSRTESGRQKQKWERMKESAAEWTRNYPRVSHFFRVR